MWPLKRYDNDEGLTKIRSRACERSHSTSETVPSQPVKARVQVKQPQKLHSLEQNLTLQSHLWQAAFLLVCSHYPNEAQLSSNNELALKCYPSLKEQHPHALKQPSRARNWPSGFTSDEMWTYGEPENGSY